MGSTNRGRHALKSAISSFKFQGPLSSARDPADLLPCSGMRLATLRDGSRDGALVVVERSGRRFVPAAGLAPTLQAALDAWEQVRPALEALSERLHADATLGAELDVTRLAAPLPRAYEWIDASSYLNHVRLVRKARNAFLTFWVAAVVSGALGWWLGGWPINQH